MQENILNLLIFDKAMYPLFLIAEEQHFVASVRQPHNLCLESFLSNINSL